MHGNFSLAQKLTTKKAQARSYAEYVSRIADNWSKLINITSEAEVYDFSESRRETLQQIAERLITEAGFSVDGLIPLNNGLCGLKDTVVSLLSKAQAIDVGPLESMPDIDSIVATTTTSFAYTVQSFNDELLNTYHSIMGDVAILEGYANGNSISEVLSIARDKMSAVFSDGFSDLSNSFEAKIQAVKSKMNITDFINHTLSFSGINQLSSGEIDIPAESDAANFTGAAPTSAYCWDQLGKAICSSFQLAASAVKNAFTWIGNKVSKLFRKAAVSLHQIVFDPYDINLINENDNDADWYVDGYLIQSSSTLSLVPKPTGWSDDLFDSVIQSFDNSTIKYDFVFGTVMFNLVFKEYTTISSKKYATFDIILQAKPKPVNFDACAKALLDTATLYTQPVTGFKYWMIDYHDVYNYLSNYGPTLTLASTDLNEVELYRCFLYGKLLLEASSYLMLTEFTEETVHSDESFYYVLKAAYDCGRSWVPTGAATGYVGNNDFFNVATKAEPFWYNIATSVDTSTGDVIPGSIPEYAPLLGSDYLMQFAELFARSKVNEARYPLDFGWLPYMKSGVQWDPGKFEIKTDEQNIARFNTFVTATVVLYYAVSIIITAVVLTKKLETTAFLKLQGALWTCTEQASSGNLTSAAIAGYKRANRKYKFISSLTSLLKRGSNSKATAIAAGTYQNPLVSNTSVRNSVTPDFNALSGQINQVKQTIVGS